jgi:hypothetical protein
MGNLSKLGMRPGGIDASRIPEESFIPSMCDCQAAVAAMERIFSNSHSNRDVITVAQHWRQSPQPVHSQQCQGLKEANNGEEHIIERELDRIMPRKPL